MEIDCKGIIYHSVPLNKATDISGQRFNHLIPLKRVLPENGNPKMTYWLCQCDCGNKVVANRVDLIRQHAKSCGCLNKELANSQLSIEEGEIIHGFKFLGKDLTRRNYSKAYYWKVECPYCGKQYSADPNTIHLGIITSCSCLNISKGELKIKNLLLKNNVSFKQQVTFSDLISKRNGHLKFDFGIYQNEKLISLIEYDGKQHFIPKERFGGKDNFEIIQENDNLKNEYCLKNNIPLIRIPYTTKEIKIDMLFPETSQFLIKRCDF